MLAPRYARLTVSVFFSAALQTLVTLSMYCLPHVLLAAMHLLKSHASACSLSAASLSPALSCNVANQLCADKGAGIRSLHAGEYACPSPSSAHKQCAPGDKSTSSNCAEPQRLEEISSNVTSSSSWRLPLHGPVGEEVSRVLGGGVVPGALILVGGDPGLPRFCVDACPAVVNHACSTPLS